LRSVSVLSAFGNRIPKYTGLTYLTMVWKKIEVLCDMMSLWAGKILQIFREMLQPLLSGCEYYMARLHTSMSRVRNITISLF